MYSSAHGFNAVVGPLRLFMIAPVEGSEVLVFLLLSW